MNETEKGLRPNTLYLVEFSDCCINGSFTSTFLGWTLRYRGEGETLVSEYPEAELDTVGYWAEMTFENGVRLNGWSFSAEIVGL